MTTRPPGATRSASRARKSLGARNLQMTLAANTQPKVPSREGSAQASPCWKVTRVLSCADKSYESSKGSILSALTQRHRLLASDAQKLGKP